MKKTITYIEPIQAGKALAFVYFAVFAVMMIPLAIFFGLMGGMTETTSGSMALFGGGIMLLFMPFVYAVIMFVLGMLMAWVYNVTYKWHGGISVNVE